MGGKWVARPPLGAKEGVPPHPLMAPGWVVEVCPLTRVSHIDLRRRSHPTFLLFTTLLSLSSTSSPPPSPSSSSISVAHHTSLFAHPPPPPRHPTFYPPTNRSHASSCSTLSVAFAIPILRYCEYARRELQDETVTDARPKNHCPIWLPLTFAAMWTTSSM
jgi:hypothetical protein